RPGLKAGQDLAAAIALDRVRPAQRQIPQPSRLALRADRLVEGERFANRRADRRWIGADRLELADVVRLPLRHRLQRPQLRDVLAPDVKQAVADRREQPLVQADAVVVALEIADLEGEVRDRVRAVDDARDAARAREPAQPLHWEQLPGEIRDVAEVEDLG